MSGLTPTQLSIRHLKAQGYHVAVTEKWNPHARVRQDLWGFGDIIAFKLGEPVLVVQTTTAPNVAARINKIEMNPIASAWLVAENAIHVHGWLKKKNRWTLHRDHQF
jgi:hypothetical protein